MSVDTALQTALTPMGLPVAPNLYKGNATEYLVTNYSTIPEVYAERAPRAARYLTQIHYYLPHRKNPNLTIRQISRALWSTGFTWPGVTNASDSEGQHYVLECEWVDGGGYYAPQPEEAQNE